MSLRWRHEVIGIGRIDALDQRLWAELDQFLAHIEAEIALAVVFVRSVAIKTVVTEDRADVAIERQLCRASQRGDREQEETKKHHHVIRRSMGTSCH